MMQLLIIMLLCVPLVSNGQFYQKDSISYTDLGDKMNDGTVTASTLILNDDTAAVFRYDPAKKTLTYFRDCLGNEQWRTFYASGELHSLTYRTQNAEVAEFYQEDGFKYKVISRFKDGRVSESNWERNGNRTSTVLRDDGHQLSWELTFDADSNKVEKSLHVDANKDTVYFQKNWNDQLWVQYSVTSDYIRKNRLIDGQMLDGFHFSGDDTLSYTDYDESWNVRYRVHYEIGRNETVRETSFFMGLPEVVTCWIGDSLVSRIRNHTTLILVEGDTNALFYEKREIERPGRGERYRAVRVYDQPQPAVFPTEWTDLDTALVETETYYDPTGKETGYVRLKIRRNDTLVIKKDPVTRERTKHIFSGIQPQVQKRLPDAEVPDFPEVLFDPMCGTEPTSTRSHQEVAVDDMQELEVVEIDLPSPQEEAEISAQLMFSEQTTGLDLSDYPCPYTRPSMFYHEALKEHRSRLEQVMNEYAAALDLTGYHGVRLVLRIYFTETGAYESSTWVEGDSEDWSPFYALGHRSGMYTFFEKAHPLGELHIQTTEKSRVERRIYPKYGDIVLDFY